MATDSCASSSSASSGSFTSSRHWMRVSMQLSDAIPNLAQRIDLRRQNLDAFLLVDRGAQLRNHVVRDGMHVTCTVMNRAAAAQPVAP